MISILKPWIFNPRLFFTFFLEQSLALKSFAAALMGINPEKILLCSPTFLSENRQTLYTQLILEKGFITLELFVLLPVSSDFC